MSDNTRYQPPKEYEPKNKDFKAKTKPTSALLIVLGGILFVAAGIAAIFGIIIGLTRIIGVVRNAVEANQYREVAKLTINPDGAIINVAEKDDTLYIETRDNGAGEACKDSSLMKYDLKSFKVSWISNTTDLDCARDLNEDTFYANSDSIAVFNRRNNNIIAFDKSGAEIVGTSDLSTDWIPLVDDSFADGKTILNNRISLTFAEDGKNRKISLIDNESGKLVTELTDRELKSGHIATPVAARWVADDKVALYYKSCEGTSECKGDYSLIRRLVNTDGVLSKTNEIHYDSTDNDIHHIESFFSNGDDEYALVAGDVKNGRKELKIFKFNW